MEHIPLQKAQVKERPEMKKRDKNRATKMDKGQNREMQGFAESDVSSANGARLSPHSSPHRSF
jgi:hypothetical protein